MTKEYIERGALIAEYDRVHVGAPGGARKLMVDAPAADVVEVIRCRDCQHWGGVTYGFICRKFSGIETKICMSADSFCSYGAKRAGNES